jgi:hypothetical protein
VQIIATLVIFNSSIFILIGWYTLSQLKLRNCHIGQLIFG